MNAARSLARETKKLIRDVGLDWLLACRGVVRGLVRMAGGPRVRVVQLLLPRCEGGIGDFLRGAICAHQVCLAQGYILQVDASRHPLGACLREPAVSDAIDGGRADVAAARFSRAPLCRTERDLLLHIPVHAQEPVVIHSVIQPRHWKHLAELPPLGAPTRELMRRFLTPSDAMRNRVDATCREIGGVFTGLHFRFGDQIMMEGKETSPRLLALAEEVTRKLVDDGRAVFVCSDSVETLEHLRGLGHPRVHVSPTAKPLNVHRQMGAEDDASDTVADLFTLLRSTGVESHSVYCWGSGFVQWPCQIASVPYRLPHMKPR